MALDEARQEGMQQRICALHADSWITAPRRRMCVAHQSDARRPVGHEVRAEHVARRACHVGVLPKRRVLQHLCGARALDGRRMYA